MSATIVGSRTFWSLERDKDGHRTYKVKLRVRTTSSEDGPQTVMQTPGLALPGTMWTQGNDFDPWAFCYPTMSVKPNISNEPNKFWTVEQTYSTKPYGRCQDTEVEDPLLEPQKIRGTFSSERREATEDKDGDRIENSCLDLIRGPQVEFDEGLAGVTIEQNVSSLQLDVLTLMYNRVNDDTLWGVPKRCIKLSNLSWDRKVWGSCNYYYTRTLDFTVVYDSDEDPALGFDRRVPDEGVKALRGRWKGNTWELIKIAGEAPDPTKPGHFNQYLDRDNNPGRVLLNGSGVPANTNIYGGAATGDPGVITIQKHKEANFLLLGIPISL